MRAQWSEDNVKLAVAAVQAGASLKKAAKDYNVPRTTLCRKLKIIEAGGEITKTLGGPSVLTKEQERQLVKLFLIMRRDSLGVYQFCVKNSVKQYTHSRLH